MDSTHTGGTLGSKHHRTQAGYLGVMLSDSDRFHNACFFSRRADCWYRCFLPHEPHMECLLSYRPRRTHRAMNYDDCPALVMLRTSAVGAVSLLALAGSLMSTGWDQAALAVVAVALVRTVAPPPMVPTGWGQAVLRVAAVALLRRVGPPNHRSQAGQADRLAPLAEPSYAQVVAPSICLADPPCRVAAP